MVRTHDSEKHVLTGSSASMNRRSVRLWSQRATLWCRMSLPPAWLVRLQLSRRDQQACCPGMEFQTQHAGEMADLPEVCVFRSLFLDCSGEATRICEHNSVEI